MSIRTGLPLLFVTVLLGGSPMALAQVPQMGAVSIVLEDDARSSQLLLLQSIQADLSSIGAICMGPIGDLERSEVSSRVRASQAALARLTQSLHQTQVQARVTGTTSVNVALPLSPTEVAVPYPVQPDAPPMTVMGSRDFQNFLGLWKGASFESERESLLKSAFGNQRPGVEQIRALLLELSFESEKLSTVEYLAPRMVIDDRPRAFQLMDTMQFPSTRTRLQEILESAFRGSGAR